MKNYKIIKDLFFFIYLFVYLFICLFVYLFICLFVYLFICLFVYIVSISNLNIFPFFVIFVQLKYLNVVNLTLV
jgi:hypothetical protein